MKLPPWPAVAAVGVLAVVTSGACGLLPPPQPRVLTPREQQLTALNASVGRISASLRTHPDIRARLIAAVEAQDLSSARAALVQAGLMESQAPTTQIELIDRRRDKTRPATRVWTSLEYYTLGLDVSIAGEPEPQGPPK
jgi:hypothetical protein